MIRIVRVPLLTWILGGAAILSASGALAIALGYASGAPILGADKSLLAPLPNFALQETRSRLQEKDAYNVIVERPLFARDRRPVVPESSDAAPFDFTLNSVIITESLSLAMLRGSDNSTISVKLNQGIETSPSWRLVELEQRQAVFDGPGGKKTLELLVFDGKGGEEPTKVTFQARSPGSAVVTEASNSTSASSLSNEGLQPSEQKPVDQRSTVKRIERRSPLEQGSPMRNRMEAARAKARSRTNPSQ